MARGTREIARLIDALGGNELSAYGLCHLGDYEATLFSPYSHNRMFGEKFVKNEPYTDLAEAITPWTRFCAWQDGFGRFADLPRGIQCVV